MNGVLVLVVIVILGASLFFWFLRHPPRRENKLTRNEVASIIESFISGVGDERTWDDFISVPINDPELEKIRNHCAALPEKFPPDKDGMYCNKDGIEILKAHVEKLRKNS